jgi:hypothetical protein
MTYLPASGELRREYGTWDDLHGFATLSDETPRTPRRLAARFRPSKSEAASKQLAPRSTVWLDATVVRATKPLE